MAALPATSRSGHSAWPDAPTLPKPPDGPDVPWTAHSPSSDSHHDLGTAVGPLEARRTAFSVALAIFWRMRGEVQQLGTVAPGHDEYGNEYGSGLRDRSANFQPPLPARPLAAARNSLRFVDGGRRQLPRLQPSCRGLMSRCCRRRLAQRWPGDGAACPHHFRGREPGSGRGSVRCSPPGCLAWR